MKKCLLLVLFLLPTLSLVCAIENPWYTGTLLSINAINQAPNTLNIQPYVFVTDNYGVYTSNWKSKRTEKLLEITPVLQVETGLTEKLDYTIYIQGWNRRTEGVHSTGFGDLIMTLGYQANVQKKGHPKPTVRLALAETFPTGKYDELDPKKLGTDGIGAGTFQTSLQFIVEKTFYYDHPLIFNFNAAYTIMSDVNVRGFSVYGGDASTDATVDPGDQLFINLAFQLSLTQRWVLALDVNYIYGAPNELAGNPGPGTIGIHRLAFSKTNHLFSLAPGIEYNFNENFGLLGALWFSIAGKNQIAFFTGAFSFVYIF